MPHLNPNVLFITLTLVNATTYPNMFYCGFVTVLELFLYMVFAYFCVYRPARGLYIYFYWLPQHGAYTRLSIGRHGVYTRNARPHGRDAHSTCLSGPPHLHMRWGSGTMLCSHLRHRTGDPHIMRIPVVFRTTIFIAQQSFLHGEVRTGRY